MNFAKPCLDVGLNTSSVEAILRFRREEVGLVYEGPLLIRQGVTQHRFVSDGSIVKVNVHAHALTDEPMSGYREVLVAKADLVSEKRLRDPDGNLVCLWPAGVGGIGQIAVRIAVRDLARHRSFLGKALGLGEHRPPYAGSACFGL